MFILVVGILHGVTFCERELRECSFFCEEYTLVLRFSSLIGEEFFVLRDTMATNVSTSVNIPNFDFEDDLSVCKEDGME